MTRCEKCVFAILKDGIQTGCELGKLEKFKERQEELLLKEGYYNIASRICKFKCNNLHGFADKTELVNALNHAHKVKVGYVVVAEDSLAFSKIEDSIISIHENKPDCVFVAVRDNSVDIYNRLRDKYPAVMVREVFDKSLELENECVRSLQTEFCVLMRAGETVPPDISEILNKAVNTELLQVGAVIDKPTVVNTKIYKHLGGNVNKPVVEKIEEIETKNKIIFRWTDLVNEVNSSNSKS